MKNIKNIIKKALLFTGSTLLLAACSLNVPPPDQFSDPDAITDVNAGALSAHLLLSELSASGV